MIGLSASIKGQYHIQVIDGITGEVKQEESFTNKIPINFLNGTWFNTVVRDDYWDKVGRNGHLFGIPQRCVMYTGLTPDFNTQPQANNIRFNDSTGVINGLNTTPAITDTDANNYIFASASKMSNTTASMEKELINRVEVTRYDIKREFTLEPKKAMSLKSLFIITGYQAYYTVLSYTNIKRNNTPVAINIESTDIIKVSFQISIFNNIPETRTFMKNIKGVTTTVTIAATTERSFITTESPMFLRFNVQPSIVNVNNKVYKTKDYLISDFSTGFNTTEVINYRLNSLLPNGRYRAMTFALHNREYTVTFDPPIEKIENEELTLSLSLNWNVNLSA